MISKADLLNTIILSAVTLFMALTYGIRVALKGRVRFERVEKEGRSPLLSKSIMEMAYWGLQPLARALAYLKVTPNQVSWCSLGFGIWAAYFLAMGHFGFGATASVVAGFADAVDGMLARQTGAASDAGEILDASLDRYVEFVFFLGLFVYYRSHLALQLLTLTALLGSFMVSYSTAKAASMGVEPPRGTMRRPERFFYLVLGAALSVVTISIWEIKQPLNPPMGYAMVGALILVSVVANVSAARRLHATAKIIRRRESPASVAETLESGKEEVLTQPVRTT